MKKHLPTNFTYGTGKNIGPFLKHNSLIHTNTKMQWESLSSLTSEDTDAPTLFTTMDISSPRSHVHTTNMATYLFSLIFLSVFTDSSHGNIGTMSYSAFIVTTCLSVSLTTDHAPKLPPFAANTTRHTHVAPHGPATATPAPPATLSVRAEPLSVCFLHQARRAHGFLPEAAEHLKCQLP